MQQFCWGQSWIIVQKRKNAIGRPAQPSSFLVLIMEVIICSVVVKGFVTDLSIYSVLWVCFLFVKCWRQIDCWENCTDCFCPEECKKSLSSRFCFVPPLVFPLPPTRLQETSRLHALHHWREPGNWQSHSPEGCQGWCKHCDCCQDSWAPS